VKNHQSLKKGQKHTTPKKNLEFICGRWIDSYVADKICLRQIIFIHERRFEKLNFPACNIIFSAFICLFGFTNFKKSDFAEKKTEKILLKKNLNGPMRKNLVQYG
jgi:hypothetical protein